MAAGHRTTYYKYFILTQDYKLVVKVFFVLAMLLYVTVCVVVHDTYLAPDILLVETVYTDLGPDASVPVVIEPDDVLIYLYAPDTDA